MGNRNPVKCIRFGDLGSSLFEDDLHQERPQTELISHLPKKLHYQKFQNNKTKYFAINVTNPFGSESSNTSQE